jgi:hypothetical protein
MINDAQMWIKLYDVLDSVQTEAQHIGAMKYAALWYNHMLMQFRDDTDADQWINAIDTLQQRKLS